MNIYENKIAYLMNKYHYVLWRNPNVVAIGLGKKIIDGYMTSIPTLTIMVSKKLHKDTLDKNVLIPSSINGILTDVIQGGVPKIISGEIRPAVGGISINNMESNRGGTIGYAVTDKGARKNLYILSCSHVLTRNYDGNKTDTILQPAKEDGGAYPKSYIGCLAKWVPVKLGEIADPKDYNEVDAAIALVDDNNAVNQKRKLMPQLKDKTIIKEISDVKQGDTIYKIGKTTNKTEGNVVITKGNVKIVDPRFGTISYKNQIIAKMLSKEGDSGALAINKANNKAIGLVTAANNDEGVTICSPIGRVLELLNVELIQPTIL